MILIENISQRRLLILLLVCVSLTTLAQMFPNLRIIGGQTLIQHYALIIYQNEDLIEIGLPKLRVIRNGGVRIAENSRMCYARYIDWKHLLAGPINDILVDDGKIKHCTEDCDVMDEEVCRHVRHGQSEKERISCWNSSTCQTNCPYDRITINGSISSIGPGCADSNFEKCHDECVAGCTVPGNNRACYGCKHYSHEGACVAQCPSHLFAYFDRRCITEAECDAIPPRSAGGSEQNHFKASHGHCRLHCPDFYEEDPSNPKKCRKCTGECHRKCHGNITVDSIMKVRTTLLLGLIGQRLIHFKFKKQNFSYLMIRLSSSFINLNIFKSLKVITGSHLYRDK
uniref:receptor protein-tyrosine kinase n=1 Tax=Heterorhabditis bacteriophora TaxID=37862 RepID=A0A1I7XBG3_HETBA